MKAEMARRICHYHLRKRVGYGEESYASATAVGTDKIELLLLDPMSVKSWIKKLGFWGFLFLLLKGLLWLTIPALITIFAD